MTDPDYLAPYSEAMRAHGPSFEATLWNSTEKQIERFDVIAGMVDLTGRVVVDAGCGLGDLAIRLDELGIAYGIYVGIEALPAFIERARERDIPESVFEHRDFVADERAFESLLAIDALRGHAIDVIAFSGSLNTLGEAGTLGVLDRAWSATGEALVFNFLSTRHHRGPEGDETAPAIRLDPLRLLDWALARTPRVLFRQDYFDGHDGTIAMLR